MKNKAITEQLCEKNWFKQFKAKVKSMGIADKLPEKSLKRMKYKNSIEFYQSVN